MSSDQQWTLHQDDLKLLKFLSNRIFYWLTYKCNLIIAIAAGLISSLYNVEMCFCANCNSLHHDSTKLYLCFLLFSFVLLFAPFLFRYRKGDDLWYTRYGFSVSAVLARAHLILFVWNITQCVWISWKWSKAESRGLLYLQYSSAPK